MNAVSLDTDVYVPPRTYRKFVAPATLVVERERGFREVICIADADPMAHEEIGKHLAQLGRPIVSATSAAECMAVLDEDHTSCVIINAFLPDASGLDLQKRIAANGNPPVIFLSDHHDVSLTVAAMKAGALEFLTKPINLELLRVAVENALLQSHKMRQRKVELTRLQQRFQLLTPRERDVLPLVVGGLPNKQAASILGISEVTLQVHRGQVMRKMQADSLADLVRMALKLRIPYWKQEADSF